MEAYCLKCRTKREIKNAESITMKNGRPATRGQCPVCESKIYRIGKGEAMMAPVLVKGVIRPWLADVPEDKVFRCHDGHVMKNLEELGTALRDMSDETFRYHITPDRNDFSKWVEEVIGDYELSVQLRNASSKTEAFKAVVNRVSWLKQ